jgi:hypothetical protein
MRKKVRGGARVALLLVGSFVAPNVESKAATGGVTYPLWLGDYTDALHIKTAARTESTSLGIGYPGDTLRSGCWATRGDAISGTSSLGVKFTNNQNWASARDLRTNVKGYSSVVYIIWNGSMPSGFYLQADDVCDWPTS